MRKISFVPYIISGVSLGVLYWFAGNFIQNKILDISHWIRHGFLESVEIVNDNWERYLMQATTIKELQQENRRLTQTNLLLQQQMHTSLLLKPMLPQGFMGKGDFRLTRVLSYSSLPGFTRMWLDAKSPSSDKIYGAVIPSSDAKEMISVGIAVWSNESRLQLLLNSDPQCTYAVTVGQVNAPGIAMGRNDKYTIVRYIPYWMDIKVGDEVITSGLDTIFSYGVRVGKVKSITGDSAYKEALVEPYFYSLSPSHVYLAEPPQATNPILPTPILKN